MEKFKIGIIGAGQLANTTHLVSLRDIERVEVVSICDVNFENAKNTAEKFGIKKYYGSHEEMLNSNKIDAVIVCVPNKFHYKSTIDSLEKGCHVFCEKPPAINYEEALAMELKAKEKNLILSYGFHFRHSKGVKVIKDKIMNGEYGEIYSSRAIWHRKRGIPGWGNFINKEIQGGGPLIDIGCHMLDIALYLLNYKTIDYISATSSSCLARATNVFLMGEYDKSKFEVEDSVFAFIKFSDDTSLIVETSFALNMEENNKRDVVIYGSKKGSTLFPLKFFGEEEGLLTKAEFDFDIEADLHKKGLINFINACNGKEELLVKAEHGTYVQKVVSKIYESAEQGKSIYM